MCHHEPTRRAVQAPCGSSASIPRRAGPETFPAMLPMSCAVAAIFSGGSCRKASATRVPDRSQPATACLSRMHSVLFSFYPVSPPAGPRLLITPAGHTKSSKQDGFRLIVSRDSDRVWLYPPRVEFFRLVLRRPTISG